MPEVQQQQIPRQTVASSNIKSIGYHPGQQTLSIEFQNGHVWHYSNVPANVHQELMGATSKGQYFAANIRRKYGETRIV
jgi:hypothetical protein